VRYGDSGLLSRLGWIALAVIVFLWIVRDPHGAAQSAHAIGAFAGQAASAFGTLMGSL
jgi:hypothetical protein